MYESRLANLLKMSALANTVNSCEDYMGQLETLKKTILRLGNKMDLVSVNQINSIDLMLSKLDRKADHLEGEQLSQKTDSLAEVHARENDKFKVSPVEDETLARKEYRK